jgi:uncharacterized protein (TIGR02284 family)
MKKNETVDLLNDLIRINNDRIEGYEKAVKETKEEDSDLRNTFNRCVDESRRYKQELLDQVRRLGGEPASDTTQSGKIYRVWMNVKSSFTGQGRQSVLELCEAGEDAAKKAYEKALDQENNLPPDVRSLVQQEMDNIRSSHDAIKHYRDIERKIKS